MGIKQLLVEPEIVDIVEDTDSEDLALRRRRLLDRKETVNELYRSYYDRHIALMKPGTRHLEIGSGGGFFHELCPGVITSDVMKLRWNDLTLDGHHIPLVDETLDNVVGLFVIHHMKQPYAFLREVYRVLKPGGRLILTEPHRSVFSYFVYSLAADEPMSFKGLPTELPEVIGPLSSANQALPDIIFQIRRSEFAEQCPGLRIAHLEHHDFLSFLLSGGLTYRQLIPSSWYRWLRRQESTWLKNEALQRVWLSNYSTIVVEKEQ